MHQKRIFLYWHILGRDKQKCTDMFRLNLKIVLRNLWKNKGYTLINVFGLSVGMASCILIFMFIRYQLNFDKGYKNDDRIYRFVTDWTYNSYQDYSQGVPVPLPAAVRNEFTGVDKVAGIVRAGGLILIKDTNGANRIKTYQNVYFTEPGFFDIFKISWLSGNPEKDLSGPGTVALSESTAKKFFGGTQQAMGKSMQYGGKMALKVIGVFKDQPLQSSFPLEVVISFQSYAHKDNKEWDAVSSSMQCYVLFSEGLKPEDFKGQLDRFNDKYYRQQHLPGNQRNAFQALKDIHFNTRYGNFAEFSMTKKEIYVLGLIGLFLILTACINFINLATAQAINRSKEVGVRKVMGSKRQQLIGYFLTETMAITICSLLFAGMMAELALPYLQNLLGIRLGEDLFTAPAALLFMVLLALFVGFMAGFYPALVMSGFSPALAIKNKVVVNKSGLSLRKVLVVFQFSMTIILLICTLVVMKQMDYVRKRPLGFNSDAVVMVNVPSGGGYEGKHASFKERLSRIAGVNGLSFCSTPPLSGDMNTTAFKLNGLENKDFEVRISRVDENYFKLFDLKIITGKVFAKNDSLNGYVVNETFLKKIYIDDPQKALGKIVEQNGHAAPIVGVVKDFNDLSLQENISPMILCNGKDFYYTIAVKLDSKQILPAMKEIETLWNNTFPDDVYYSWFVNDGFARYYKSERLMGTMFRLSATLVICISFIGLFGLISFVATQRTREVAIRKVLGASTYQVMRLLNSAFLLMVFMANLLAWPLAYIFVSRWLSGFAYHIELSVWPFVFAMLLSMLITLITVSIRSYRAAIANTVDALKYE